jgi:ubiquinone/menaquinone biosynthesis C-methylase UbiE
MGIPNTSEDDFGEKYFDRWISDVHDPRLVSEHRLVVELMRPQPTEIILDVGCGKGRLGYFLLQQQPGIEMVFSDVTTEAKKHLEGQTFVQCSMASLPFPDSSFNKIFCMHVIAHFAEGDKAIKEAFRVLKKGGGLMILTPNKYYVYLSWIMTAIKKTKSGKRFKYDTTARWLYSKNKLRQQMNLCNWSSVEYSYFEPPPRLCPFEWLRAKLIVVATK